MAGTTREMPVRVRMPRFGVAAFTSRHSRRFRMAFQTQGYHKLAFVAAGAGRLTHASGGAALEAGDLVRVPPGCAHAFTDDSAKPMTLSVVCVTDAALAQPEAARVLWSSVQRVCPANAPVHLPHAYAQEEHRRLFQQLVLALHDGGGARRAALALAGVLQLLAAVQQHLGGEARPRGGRTRRVHDPLAGSLAYIDDHFTQPLRVEDLARRAGMSYRSYTEHFHRRTGMTVTRYVNRRRVALARGRILETGDILGSALAAGFGDLSHFYRIYKRESGQTPGRLLVEARGR